MQAAQASNNAPAEIRPGTAPPANATSYGARLPPWLWGQPARYYGRAGYRDDFGGGGRTSKGHCDPATYLRRPLRRLADGSRPPTPEGSLPPFGWGDVATPVRPVTGRPSLAPRSSTRSPVGSPYGSLALAGGLRAYHVAPPKPRGLGRASTPVARHLRRGSSEPPNRATYHFGPGLSAPLACSCVTTLAALHLG